MNKLREVVNHKLLFSIRWLNKNEKSFSEIQYNQSVNSILFI